VLVGVVEHRESLDVQLGISRMVVGLLFVDNYERGIVTFHVNFAIFDKSPALTGVRVAIWYVSIDRFGDSDEDGLGCHLSDSGN
jgi:hypothetical protein